MTKRILIDAVHPEETRVVVADDHRLLEFDYESASKRQLKANIYLGKIIRVEPSLQAAFVEYGGNRHGFLPLSEIHPDYFRIPVSDQEEVIPDFSHPQEPVEAETAEETEAESVSETEAGPETEAETGAETELVEDDLDAVSEDELGAPKKIKRLNYNKYKIQEVIHKRQIVLIQVTKEERGNKGAALTTYLSLAGRYCVLMPNSQNAGGISRKITNPKDRKRLKEIIDSLNVPLGLSVIIRTAGIERNKAEIRKDFEYLVRLWDNIRAKTLESIAPTLVYEEDDLIKRSIRDLYNKDVSEILIEGEEGYKLARSFMRLIMPSHVKKVILYNDPLQPLFHKFRIEHQFEELYNPSVKLKSGGSLVINPTEALVAIDINSGRSTRERHIEETAYNTNMEAAEEIARQLRLRDLGGLIVVDFIDMQDERNINSVERKFREALRQDRARIQIGHISSFGLMEITRQRLRPSLFETFTQTCPHCLGTGHIRSKESSSLHLIRLLEEEGIKNQLLAFRFYLHTDMALYLLNEKRETMQSIEARYGIKIHFVRDDKLTPPNYRIEPLTYKNKPTKEAKSAKPAKVSKDHEQTKEGAEPETPQHALPRTSEHKKLKKRRRNRKDRDRDRDRPAYKDHENVKANYKAATSDNSDLIEEDENEYNPATDPEAYAATSLFNPDAPSKNGRNQNNKRNKSSNKHKFRKPNHKFNRNQEYHTDEIDLSSLPQDYEEDDQLNLTSNSSANYLLHDDQDEMQATETREEKQARRHSKLQARRAKKEKEDDTQDEKIIHGDFNEPTPPIIAKTIILEGDHPVEVMEGVPLKKKGWWNKK